MIPGYREIVTQEQLDELTAGLAEFHDTLVKEVHMVSRAFMDANRSVHLHSGRDLRLLLNPQWASPSVEFLCCNVSCFTWLGDPLGLNDTAWHGVASLQRASGTVDRQEVRIEIERELKVFCERLFVAERPDWVGPAARLQGEVPALGMSKARDLGAGVWQCGNCCATFPPSQAGDCAHCPECHSLTHCIADE